MLKTRKKLITNSLIEVTSNEGKGKGKYFVSKFIEAGLAHYKELGDIVITKETLDKFIQTMVGCPVIIDHEDVNDKNVEDLRVGVISRVWYNDMDGWYYCEGIITDDEAVNLIKNEGWSVSCAYSFVADETQKTYHGKPIDMVFTDGEFLHLAIVEEPRYEGANIVVNSKEVENGFITIDAGTENERVVWIPENVHYVKPSERKRVLEICDNYKAGDKTIYNFEHTRVKPTKEQIDYLKNAVKEIEDTYKYKGIAQIEISSSLNSGSWGVCFSPENTSLISIAPSMYKENAQKKYDESVKNGFHPKGTGEAIKSVLVHEIGHAITCNSKDKTFWNKIDTIRSDYLKNIKKDDLNNPDFISNYARENKYEFVAEAFCQGHLSKKYGKYTEKVMNAINEHFGKTYQTKLFNAKEKDENNDDMWIEGFGFGYPIDESSYKEFKDELEKQKKEDEKQTKNSIDKENTIMSVMDDLKDFILGVVNNEKEDEMKVKNEDKRKLIDEIGGILKDKVDDEIIRTVIKKAEELSYEPSEDDKADNKAKNEEDKDKAKNKCKNEEEEEKEDKKEVKNSMKDFVMGGKSEVEEKSLYISTAKRLELGNKY